MNSCESVRKALEEISKSQIVEELQILETSALVVKARIRMSRGLFLQVYRNDRFRTTNFALVLERQRIYARDELNGEWHRHPYDEPEMHDHSTEGARPVSLGEFWEEVQELLCKFGWIM